MANIITTGSFGLPDSLYPRLWGKVQDASAIAKLAPAEGFVYGNTDVITFTDYPRAEFVAEGGNKSASKTGFAIKKVATHKVQVTVRTTDEVLIMDEQRQVGVLDAVMGQMGIAIARAMDIGAFHKIDPLSGTTAASITDNICATTNSVTASAPRTDLDTAVAAVIADGFSPNGIALDPSYAFAFKTAYNSDGSKQYPEVSMNVRATSTLDGLTAAVSDTVSASKEAASPTNVKGVVGDWNAFKWGIVRNVPISMIQFGDPDGQGDLKRMNQVALRAEAYIAWAVMDKDAFCKIVSA